MRGRTKAALGGAVAVGYVALQVAGRISGSTRAERASPLPGDDLLARPGVVTNHAATLVGPPEEVWPWLTEMGWHRGGWFSPRWLHRILFPRSWASAETLDAESARDLQPGDSIPEGPSRRPQFVVAVVDAPRTLVLHSTTQPTPAWVIRRGATVQWVWTFRLEPVGEDRTRLLLRNRGTVRPWWADLAYQAAIAPADHLVSRGMLRGLGNRVARDRRLGAHLRRRTRIQEPAQIHPL